MEKLLETLIQDYLALSLEIDELDTTANFDEKFRLLQKRTIAKLESELHRQIA